MSSSNTVDNTGLQTLTLASIQTLKKQQKIWDRRDFLI